MHKTQQLLHKTAKEDATEIKEGCAMGIELTFAGFYDAPKGHDMPFHAHQEWELVFYRAGLIETVLGSETYQTAPGILVLTPPGVPHAEYALTPYANIYLGVNAPDDSPWPRTCTDDAEQTLGHLFRNLVYEWHAQRPERTTMLSLLLQQLDLVLRRATSAQNYSATEKLVADAERYIQEHHHRSLTIEEIAQELGVSSATLRHHFLRQRNSTPMALLQHQRVQHAQELLRTSSLKLETIAHLCGYDSASHLSRHFKKILGQRPGDVRS